MDDVVALLERQMAALRRRQDIANFLASIEPMLSALWAEPRLAVHLSDLQDETIDRVRVLEGVDAELTTELVGLRQRLVTLWPKLDDSDRPPPGGDMVDPTWRFSLAGFDSIVAGPTESLNYKGEGARTADLLTIMQARARVLDELEDSPRNSQSSDEEQWLIDLHNIQERWDHASRWLSLSMRVSAGLALLQLEAVPRALNPEPVMRHLGEDRQARLEALFRRAIGSEQLLFRAVHGDGLRDSDRSLVSDRVDELRAGLDRLELELIRRVGMTRSRRALIDRFKIRAEWHDARRLRAIADDDAPGGGPEDRLTDELARFLFDHGLNPLTKPLAGGLQPDLLDASLRPAFYVEAKQYRSSARQQLIRAIGQVIDTVGRLQGGEYAVTEAFCVVFRLDGPRYVLPEFVQAEGYRVYLLLVDIAPASVSGRRQRHRPSVIQASDLLEAAPTDAEPKT